MTLKVSIPSVQGVPVLRPTVIWPIISTLVHYNLALSNVALCNLAL